MESLVTTKELIDVLTQTFSLYIKEDIVDKHPAVFIKGVPGVGKSQAILKIKNNLKTITNKEIVLKDVRLLLYSPLDLNGIPVPDKEKKKAIWLTPRSEEHTSELQSRPHLVCRLLLEKKKQK